MSDSIEDLKAKHAPFGDIYLDSNVLLPSWPYDVPAATKQVLHLAGLLDIRVYLPVPVDIELQAHWERENVTAMLDALTTVRTELPRLIHQWKCDPSPAMSSLRESYRSVCEKTKT